MSIDLPFYKDKAVLVVRKSVWSGQKSISDDELMGLGIRDPKEFRQEHTPGSRILARKDLMRPFERVRSRIDKEIDFYSTKFLVPSVRLVHKDLLDVLVGAIEEGRREMEREVEVFLRDHYDREREAYAASVVSKSYSTSFEKALSDYPSQDTIRSRFRVEFSAMRTPTDSQIEGEVGRLCAEYARNQVREVVEETSRMCRSLLEGAVSDFVSTVSGKDSDSKINQRTVRKLDESLQRFLNLAPTFGDTRISDMVRQCRESISRCPSWTKADAEEHLGESMQSLMAEAMNREVLESEAKIYADEMVGEIAEDASISGAFMAGAMSLDAGGSGPGGSSKPMEEVVY